MSLLYWQPSDAWLSRRQRDTPSWMMKLVRADTKKAKEEVGDDEISCASFSWIPKSDHREATSDEATAADNVGPEPLLHIQSIPGSPLDSPS